MEMNGYANPDDLFEEVQDDRVIGEHMISRYRCKACGGEAFRIYSGDYKTAISCVVCDKPAIVHSG